MSLEYKGYQIVGDGTFGNYLIKQSGKGSVHLSLRGTYTSTGVAKRSIDQHESSKVAKGGKSV